MPLRQTFSPSNVAAAVRADRSSQVVALALVAAAIVTAVLGGAPALLVYVLGVPIVVGVAHFAADLLDRPYLIRLMLVTLAGRAVLAAVLHVYLVSHGNALGAMFQDDGGYAITGGALAKTWQGLQISSYEHELLSDPSIANGYVGLTAVLLWALGGSILAVKLVNSILGVIHVALVYRTMRNLGLPGARLAALGMAVFPTLVLWSVLTLKDASSMTLMLLVLWSISELQRGARWWPWPITALSMYVLRDIRLYLFVILTVAWPLGLFIARRRVASLAALAISAVLLVLSTSALGLFAPGVLDIAANTRGWMAEGARSAFVQPPPIAEAAPGQAYRVAVPGLTQDPNRPARRIEVSPGTELIVDCSSTPQPVFGQTARPRVCVSTGDVVVVGRAAGSPVPEVVGSTAASPTPRDLTVRSDFVNVVSTAAPAASTGDDVFTFEKGIVENVQHLPIGVAFLLGAPFPLTARTASEIGLVPDTLLWYLTVVLAAIGLVHIVRRRDTRFAVGVLAMGAISLVLSLTEGNLGTLVRHRAMLIPFVVMLAAAGAMWSPRVLRLVDRARAAVGR